MQLEACNKAFSVMHDREMNRADENISATETSSILTYVDVAGRLFMAGFTIPPNLQLLTVQPPGYLPSLRSR